MQLLASILSPDAAFPQLSDTTKKQALKTLAAHAERLTGLDAAHIFSVLMEREQAGCTGVGEGIGIPHGRFEGLDRIHALAATLARPIEFGAADGLPVDILFVLLTPASANTEHLKAMATISRLLRDEHIRRALRAAKVPEDLHGILTYPRGGEQA